MVADGGQLLQAHWGLRSGTQEVRIPHVRVMWQPPNPVARSPQHSALQAAVSPVSMVLSSVGRMAPAVYLGALLAALDEAGLRQVEELREQVRAGRKSTSQCQACMNAPKMDCRDMPRFSSSPS